MRARDIVQQVLLRVQQAPSQPSQSTVKKQPSRNDDGSMCSTLTVDHPSQHKPQTLLLEDHSSSTASSTAASSIRSSSSSTSVSHSKNVHFGKQSSFITWIDPEIDLTAEDCDNLWYSQDDYRLFKATNTHLAKSLALAEQSRADENGEEPFCQATLLNLYSACCLTTMEPRPPLHHCSSETSRSSHTSINSTSKSRGGGSILTKAEERKLMYLYEHEDFGDMLVGVERQMCRGIYKDKYQRRIRLVHLVYEIQETFAPAAAVNTCGGASSSSSSSSGCYQNDAMAEELRRECQNVSRASRLFARHIALAQMNSNV